MCFHAAHVTGRPVNGIDTDPVTRLEVIRLALMELGVYTGLGLQGFERRAECMRDIASDTSYDQGKIEAVLFPIAAKVIAITCLLFVQTYSLGNQLSVRQPDNVNIGITNVFYTNLLQETMVFEIEKASAIEPACDIREALTRPAIRCAQPHTLHLIKVVVNVAIFDKNLIAIRIRR